jgi:peroxiredoxin Q/BCP
MDLLNKEPIPFCLPDQDNNTTCINDLKGKWILIFFYPGDFTPDCIKQVCEIRDAWNAFRAFNAEIYGVSPDSVESHKKFKNEYNLPFDLLSDKNKEVINKYGVNRTDVPVVKKYVGTKRYAILINPDYKVMKVYQDIDPTEEPKLILKEIYNLSKE